MKISDQTVLITGAAQGLGLAIAKAFAKEKAKLILIDKKPTTAIIVIRITFI